MTGPRDADWAQDAFYTSQVISDAEIAWKILRDADENGQRVSPSQALEEAHSIMVELVPPTSALMERSGWGGDRHHALVRYAYARAARRWTARKVWVDLELPIAPPERKKPPQRPKMTFTPWGRLPKPDVFLESTDESRVWIECQTVSSWGGLREKAEAARAFGAQNAYSTFVVVGVSPDDRYLEEVREAVNASGKSFEHWDPTKEPLAEVGKDAIALFGLERLPPPPKMGPYQGVERFWAWRGESNRSPAIIDHSVSLRSVPAGAIEFVPVPWPKSCPACDGTGSVSEGAETTCERCSGNGCVPAGSKNWKLCPACWGAQKHAYEPCLECQGRGWEWGNILKQVRIPAYDPKVGSTTLEFNFYPEEGRRARKVRLRVSVGYDPGAGSSESNSRI